MSPADLSAISLHYMGSDNDVSNLKNCEPTYVNSSWIKNMFD